MSTIILTGQSPFTVQKLAGKVAPILFSDGVIRCTPDGHDILPYDARLFIEVVEDGNSIQKTELLMQESTMTWGLDEAIELSEYATSYRLIITMECPGREFQQLGFADLTSADLLIQCAEGDREYTQGFVRMSNSPSLEHLSFSSGMWLDIPDDCSADIIHNSDAAKEEVLRHQLLFHHVDEGSIEPARAKRMLYNIRHDWALQLADTDTEKPLCLKHVGDLFHKLHSEFYETADLDTAIIIYDAAVRLMPDNHHSQAELYTQLGISLLLRFQYSGNITDVDNAILNFEKSLLLTPDDHASKPGCLNDLGHSFNCRFKYSADLVDSDSAISAHEQAISLVPDGHVNRPAYLNNLGTSFLGRFEQSGDLVDSDRAISTHKEAVNLTPDGHTSKPGRLNNLGNSFSYCFEHSGDLADCDRAISAHEQAANLTPDDGTEKPIHLSNLGASFLSRFEWSENLIDSDRALSAHEQAVNLTSDGHANKPGYLTNLGNSLLRHFESSRDIVDSDKAISAHEQAVKLVPDGHTNKPAYLNNLGNSCSVRFKLSRDLVDLDRAISAHEQAVKLVSDSQITKPAHLTNLGSSFLSRFEQSGNLLDNDKALLAHQEAVNLTPDSYAGKPNYLNCLGNSFLGRFQHSRDLADNDRALSAHQQAVNLTPDGHADKLIHLTNLGNSFALRFEHTQNLVDSNMGIIHYRSAATCFVGAASIKFEAAVRWARLASMASDPSALQGYTIALNRIPQVAWLGHHITTWHRYLSSMAPIASEAAAAAAAAEQYETALELLEQGRSIVWNQFLSLRTPVDALHDVDPTLADTLTHTSMALEHASTGESIMQDLSGLQPSMQETAQHHHQLAKEWEGLVTRVRNVPGFEDFLCPKKFTQLHNAARAGPVVVINVHKHRCDAFALVDSLNEVVHIPLINFSYEKAQQLHHHLSQLLSTAGVRAQDIRATKMAITTKGGGFEFILSSLWSFVVKPVLDCLGFTVLCKTNPPRIWWCVTGPLAFLPIHAAGIYNMNTDGFNISDYVVSSYTPTLSVIINANKSHKIYHKFQGLLAVSQPDTPGQSPLPNTKRELDIIQEQGSRFKICMLKGPEALVRSVIEGMESHSWVHFACHAVQDTVKPTKSAFCLHDENLELSMIITKSFPHADFAFLSACQTATGDEKLSEEAIHLAAGLMLAGYQSIIATMWSINDKDAPVIADHVYTKLFGDGKPDSTEAALALHGAVKLLRQQVGDSAFISWVPFIHVGV